MSLNAIQLSEPAENFGKVSDVVSDTCLTPKVTEGHPIASRDAS